MTPHATTLPSGTCICRNPECQIPYGTCHCGCGRTTTVAKLTDNKIGKIAGFHTKYCSGHRHLMIRSVEDAEPFKIDGVYCRLIPLTKGQWAIVSAYKYECLSQHKWQAQWNPPTRSYYAQYTTSQSGTSRKTVSMARLLLGLTDDDQRRADHINHVTLDNRDANLRAITASQNNINSRLARNNTSGRKGVSWHCLKGVWQSRITVGGITYRLGDFWNFDDACIAREQGETKYHGRYACKG